MLMDTAEVYRGQVLQGDSGGLVASEAVLVETTSCRLLPVKAASDAPPDALLVRIVVPSASEADRGDELRIDGRGFLVTEVFARAPGIVKTLHCTRV